MKGLNIAILLGFKRREQAVTPPSVTLRGYGADWVESH